MEGVRQVDVLMLLMLVVAVLALFSLATLQGGADSRLGVGDSRLAERRGDWV